MRKKICILGASGSIGTQALDIVSAFPDRFEVIGLTAGTRLSVLQDHILTHKPKWAMIHNPEATKTLQDWAKTLPFPLQIMDSSAELETQLTEPALDLVIMAIVGTAALWPTAAALKAGKTVALASKEVLVAAGDLMMGLTQSHGSCLLPIDSEHAALQQCLASVQGDTRKLARVFLTASGGPFRNRDRNTFDAITVAEARQHPKWQMGAKISIDSATLLNKGLEVIEAHHLFGLSYDHIEVLIHPQSIVHAMTEGVDGNLLAHLGPPDMRFPIQYAMTYPDKVHAPWPRLDITKVGTLSFESPDVTTFPLLPLAYACGRQGGSAPVVLNAANEALVMLFLDAKIGFLDISRGIVTALERFSSEQTQTLADIAALDIAVKKHVIDSTLSQKSVFAIGNPPHA